MAADPIYIDASADDDLVITGVTKRRVEEGATWGLEDSVVLQESDSGLVVAIERWPRRRHRGSFSWGPDHAEFMETLFAVNGLKHPFLFIPPRARNYKVTNHWFATGDGTEDTFQLTRGVLTLDAASSTVRSFSFNVYYPLDDDFLAMRENGTPVDFTLGSRGQIIFDTPPALDAILHADFHYATPVRFASEFLDVTMREADQDEIRSVSIVEDFE